MKNDANFSRIMRIITLTVPATTWRPTTPFAVGDCVRPTAPEPGSTLYFECTVAGSSGGRRARLAGGCRKQDSRRHGRMDMPRRFKLRELQQSGLPLLRSGKERSRPQTRPPSSGCCASFASGRSWTGLSPRPTLPSAPCSAPTSHRSRRMRLTLPVSWTQGLRRLLPRLGIVKRVMNALGLTVQARPAAIAVVLVRNRYARNRIAVQPDVP